jgi:peptide/nickel transport system permease protein
VRGESIGEPVAEARRRTPLLNGDATVTVPVGPGRRVPSGRAGGRPLARIGRDPLAAVSAGYLVLVALVALLAPVIAPIDPHAIVDRPLRSPGEAALLGTDDVGRDLLSRLVHASRISLAVGVGAALLTATIGTCIGGLAGYYGGRLDVVLSGLVNVMLSIPTLPLALVISAFVEIRLSLLVLIIGGVSWTGTARIVRAEVLSLREREFVVAARALGARDGRLILRHALVNAAPPIIVAATLQVATAILAESALSYLGYGIQPPEASWGNMLQNAQRYLRIAPALAVYPGLLISLTVVSINFVGDALRDALDPARRGAPNW